ncbi:MAG TPA: archease [Polyangiaceae bacterium]|nr:archease [Polyangiaceae bacterium]
MDDGSATTTPPGHRFIEHTGELELRFEATDFASLLEESAHALAGILAEDADGAPTRAPERIELAAPDRESLLVGWLNELVYRGEVNKCVYGKVHVDRASDRHLKATVCGREPSSPRTAVKAATWHRLRVKETPAGFEATVVFDV